MRESLKFEGIQIDFESKYRQYKAIGVFRLRFGHRVFTCELTQSIFAFDLVYQKPRASYTSQVLVFT